MLTTDISTGLLAIILYDEAECESQVEHHCTVKARWICVCGCPLETRLWCDGRYRLYVQQSKAGWFCTCDRLQTSCWTVRPV